MKSPYNNNDDFQLIREKWEELLACTCYSTFILFDFHMLLFPCFN